MADSLSKDQLTRIKQEVILSEKVNENNLEPRIREAIARYTSRHIPDVQSTQDWDVVLNEVYPIIQYELPSTFFRSPRTFLKPRQKTFIAKRRNPLSGIMEEVELDSTKSAKTQEAIMNYKLETIRYKNEVQKALLDALLFPHGVLWHGYKGDFGMTQEQSLFIEDEDVFVQRLNPMRFLKDPSVPMSNLEEARWVGRSFDVPYRELVEDDILDVDKSQIKGNLGYGELVGLKKKSSDRNAGGQDILSTSRALRPLSEFLSKDYQNSTMARFVQCYEIFIRPTAKEKRQGGKGTILLYTKEQDKPLRISNWGYKAKGWPAKILCFNPLNDDMFGLSDIEVYGPIADQKNMVVNLQLRNAKENSKVWVGFDMSGLDEEDISKIQSGDQTIIGFKDGNINEKIQVKSAASMGSGELYLLDGRIQRNLEDKSGVSDLKKGFLQSGEESATSVKIRNSGGSVRALYRQDIMTDFLKESIHFLNQLIKQYYPVEKAVRIVGSLDVQWSDNPSKEEIQAETDVEIDVISMLPEDPDKEVQQLEMVLNLMIQAINDPGVSQKIAQEGMTFNISPIVEQLLMRLRIKDPDVFRKIRPEESQGFASVAELRAAGDNVKAALSGGQPPSPAQPGQDHRARLEIYGEFAQLLQQLESNLGETVAGKILQSLMMAQSAMAEEDQQKQPKEGTKIPSLKLSQAKAA